MLTKETTKRAAKILAAQKKEYARSFEAAKGNSKAIAKAAADYRAEYGKTPKKRWANALSQAAKETATHERPRRKTADAPATKPKAATPVAKPAAPKPVVIPASKALPTPKFKLPVYIIPTYHMKNHPLERQDPYVETLNKREFINGHYEYQQVTYTVRGGAHVSSRISEEDLMKQLADKTYTRLTQAQFSERRMAHNSYWAREKQRQAREREEQRQRRVAQEKQDKAAFREAHKVNPEWIKNFAKQTGVSQPVIKALYAICDNPSRKEDLKLRPVLGGIYCDPDGHLVATDAFILVSVEAKVPKSLAGKIYLKSGQTQGGKYPNYKVILEHKELLPNGTHRVRPYVENKGGKPSQTLTDNWGNKYFDACGGRWREDMYRLILNVFEAIGETPKAYHVDAEKEAKYKVGHEAFYKDVEFNSIKAKLLATLPMSYISKRVNAIQMPLAQ